ncbi:MAG TPA: VWA domain-containing protein [Bryobacteraceae bacterium]
MRLATLLATLLLATAARAQFKSTVPLVVAPTSVTDAKGHYVDGLTTQDLVLYDNDVPQPIQMDWTAYPIDLVVAVQTSSNSGAVLDKLGGSGILATQLVAADAGETAVLSFSDEVNVRQDFTGNPDLVSHALRMLRKDGDGAHMLDALRQALVILQHRPLDRRRIILMIAEKRDRSSDANLDDVMEQVERANAAVYWLTFSPFLEPFTTKPRTAEDLKPIDKRDKLKPDTTAVPPDVGPGSPIYALGELYRLHKPDLAALFARTTGGDTLNFLKKNALEQSIQRIGAEVHSQYILSFQPKSRDSGKFHTIRVVAKDRPDLHVRTRAGYWALE